MSPDSFSGFHRGNGGRGGGLVGRKLELLNLLRRVEPLEPSCKLSALVTEGMPGAGRLGKLGPHDGGRALSADENATVLPTAHEICGGLMGLGGAGLIGTALATDDGNAATNCGMGCEISRFRRLSLSKFSFAALTLCVR